MFPAFTVTAAPNLLRQFIRGHGAVCALGIGAAVVGSTTAALRPVAVALVPRAAALDPQATALNPVAVCRQPPRLITRHTLRPFNPWRT